MKNTFLVVLFLTFTSIVVAQNDRQVLRGKVLYKGGNVPNENVINSTSETATITNDDGEFVILVKEGDQLVFTAVNFQ